MLCIRQASLQSSTSSAIPKPYSERRVFSSQITRLWCIWWAVKETEHALLCLLLIVMKQGDRLTEVNYNKISHMGNLNRSRPLNRGDRWIEVKFTVNKGSKFREIDRWPFNRGMWCLIEGCLIEVWLYTAAVSKNCLRYSQRMLRNLPVLSL